MGMHAVYRNGLGWSYMMQKFQKFIVSWTSIYGGEQRAVYNSIEEATLRYDQLKKVKSEDYVYLSVVIDYKWT